jgi:Helicase conserved C-terminal domain
MGRVDESIINYDLIEDVLKTILLKPAHGWGVLRAPPGANLEKGSVLVFLPGLGEIKTLAERLQGSREFGRRDAFDIIPMHSSLSSTDQRRAFRVQPEGSLVRKIVVATNIAETSVTIPDVTYGTNSLSFCICAHDSCLSCLLHNRGQSSTQAASERCITTRGRPRQSSSIRGVHYPVQNKGQDVLGALKQECALSSSRQKRNHKR